MVGALSVRKEIYPRCLFLFDLILFIPSSIFIYVGIRLTSTMLGLMCLAQGHKAGTPVRCLTAWFWFARGKSCSVIVILLNRT